MIALMFLGGLTCLAIAFGAPLAAPVSYTVPWRSAAWLFWLLTVAGMLLITGAIALWIGAAP